MRTVWEMSNASTDPSWRNDLIRQVRVYPSEILLVERYHQVNLRVRSGMENQSIISCATDNAERSQMLYQSDVVLTSQGHNFKFPGDIMLDQLMHF